ncbi:MAG TPA: Lrp/AsnC family transcriptional regulator [Capillimicrobium sp.]|nr:Lrp/AsnC family transcriptional regulator [Capillimicrobium sp.]
MDDIDRAILSRLVQDGRCSYRELGAAVGLSANAAADRVRRLRREGVITGFTALVDPAAGGRRIEAVIDVKLGRDQDNDGFEAAIEPLTPIVEAAHLTGRADYELRVVCRDAAELDGLLRTLKREAGAAETETRIVLRTALRRRSG